MLGKANNSKEKKTKESKALPKAIAIDEFKGNAGGKKFQLIIADTETKSPWIPHQTAERKQSLLNYIEHGASVEIVVMDMNHSFKVAVQQALNKPVTFADRFSYIYWALDRVNIRVQKDWNNERIKGLFIKQ